MTLPELIHGLETRLKKAVELLDEEKVGKTGQSHEYYKAQTDLMSYVTAHSWDILEQLERLQKMDEQKVRDIRGPEPIGLS